MKTSALLVSSLLLACGGGTPSSTTQNQAAPIPSAQAPKTYAIKLAPTSKVGDKLHVVADDVSDKVSRVGPPGHEADKDKEHEVYHLDAVWTVLAVDGSGRPTKDRYDITELLSNGKPLATGVVEVTRARKEDDATVLLAGKPANKDVKSALKELLSLSVGGPTDDDMFGTQQPQAVGAHWTGNNQLAHDDLLSDTGIDAKTVTTDVNLAGIVKDGGVDCLEVRAGMKLEQVVLPGMPPSATVDESNADVTLRATMPIGGTPPRVSEETGMAMTIKMHVSANGQNVPIVISFTAKKTAHYSALTP